MKKILITLVLIGLTLSSAAEIPNLFHGVLHDNDIVANFKHLSSEQLLDTANYYFNKNSADTALLCYGLIINTIQKNPTVEQQKRIVQALNKSAIIYCSLCDYRKAYELFINALHLCDMINDLTYQSAVLLNIGNVYYRFKEYDMANLYYSKAMPLFQDTAQIVLVLNNMGASELGAGNLDSAFSLLSKALPISKRHKDVSLYNLLNNFALYYEEKQLYDSAFHYHQLSLNEVRKHNKIEEEAEFLSQLGNLFYKIGKTDSALFYIGLSNVIAQKNNFLRISSLNYQILSDLEKSKKRYQTALEYFEKHLNLENAIANTAVFGDISQLQYAHDISKLNLQIDRFVIDQKIKERTIFYQNIGLFVLLVLSAVLLFVYFQKKRLDTAYKLLFEKNLEIISLQDNSTEKESEKYKKSALKDEVQNELLNRILLLMENTSLICDTEFSIEKLAKLVQSNQTYVSQVINGELKKNFKSFLNTYRIREAQRLFSEPEITKYTIEALAFKVGFKSRNAFSNAFKEITGVSPTFYLRSMQR
ncbi:MAG: AraC family transcriptional regulator [Bacteroidales bacterium]|nr:AraC family transcriptional regulator [Bacteroidales bacterium]MCL2133777.1 AraC family transcriptional regulator [Bacteroidales bacterium]